MEQRGTLLITDWHWSTSEIRGSLNTLSPQDLLFYHDHEANTISVGVLGAKVFLQADRVEASAGFVSTSGTLSLEATFPKVQITL